MRGIYSDVSHNGDTRKLEKLRLFFNLPDHACNTMKHHPNSVIDEYLKMHKKEEITYEDICKLVEMDFMSTKHDSSGLKTNVMEYLAYYVDTSKLNRIPYSISSWKEHNVKDFDFKPLVEETVNKMLDTRDGKILLLTGSKED